MKVLVVVAAFVALCSSNAVPNMIPGDNSGYVEGESRYIWMPDNEGNPVLVDLQTPVDKAFLASRDGADNEYWLYTSENPDDPQIIVNGDADTISSSNYNASRVTNIIVHGWNNNGSSDVNLLVRTAFLDAQDCNVIVVDWNALASSLYTTAVAGVPSVGQYLGNFLTWLIDTSETNWNNVHLVGHSLGAHVVGVAGRTTGSSPARITGLDPAGPLFTSNSNALNSTDAQYVEAIHTDGGFLGLFGPVAQADFYPNGGSNPQPGCLISTCSHSRSYELFAATVTYNHLVGLLCDDIDQASNEECTGDTFNMGNAIVTKQGAGIYGLTTDSSYPY